MNILELRMRYKAETSRYAVDEEDLEIDVFRSKGQWVLNISDVEKFNLAGNYGVIRFTRPDAEYVLWLEEKLMSLL